MSAEDTPADRPREGDGEQQQAGASGGARQSGQGRPQGRKIASGSHPVITGTAAARLLGKTSGEDDAAAGSATGAASDAPAQPAAQQGGAATGSRGRSGAGRGRPGVDAPTSNIDRADVPRESMPDLGSVSHSAPAKPAAPSDDKARPRVTVGPRRSRGPLRASMQLRSIDPWSALKVSLLLSVAMFLVWMVAVGIVYVVLDGMGVWDRLNTGVTDIISDFDEVSTLIGPGQVFGVAAIVGIINIVLFTALSTLGAFIYNLSSDMVGGVEVTLADRD